MYYTSKSVQLSSVLVLAKVYLFPVLTEGHVMRRRLQSYIHYIHCFQHPLQQNKGCMYRRSSLMAYTLVQNCHHIY